MIERLYHEAINMPEGVPVSIEAMRTRETAITMLAGILSEDDLDRTSNAIDDHAALCERDGWIAGFRYAAQLMTEALGKEGQA